MDVNEVLLPGVGLRYDFVNIKGDHIGIVALRSGDFEVAVYDVDDPDRAVSTVNLDAEEADTVAQILGAPRFAERFADLTKEVPGLVAGQVEIPPESACVGRPLGDTRARTLTGASIVAVVRADTVVASPGPEELLRAGDTLVVIGTEQGVAGVTDLVRR